MKLGLFSMPLHRPEKPFLQTLEEDREAILLADRLGYSEAWIGEHFTSKVEQIASPLIFLATLIHETRSIRFGTGVINIPHHHPVTVASHVALFDNLSEGRFLFGVGPGGLVSDAEMYGPPGPGGAPAHDARRHRHRAGTLARRAALPLRERVVGYRHRRGGVSPPRRRPRLQALPGPAPARRHGDGFGQFGLGRRLRRAGLGSDLGEFHPLARRGDPLAALRRGGGEGGPPGGPLRLAGGAQPAGYGKREPGGRHSRRPGRALPLLLPLSAQPAPAAGGEGDRGCARRGAERAARRGGGRRRNPDLAARRRRCSTVWSRCARRSAPSARSSSACTTGRTRNSAAPPCAASPRMSCRPSRSIAGRSTAGPDAAAARSGCLRTGPWHRISPRRMAAGDAR